VKRLVLGFFLIILLLAAMVAVATVPGHRTSFHSPVFAPGATAVVSVRRDLDLWVFGPGLEMLTPPARVRLRRDRYRVVRLDRGTGIETTLATLPPSPLEGTWMDAYRSHVAGLGYVRASTRWRGGSMEWAVSVSIDTPTGPMEYSIASTPAGSGWRRANASITSDDRATLSGDDEVLVMSNAPCAVVLLNAARKTVRALGDLSTCGGSGEPTFDAVEPYAHRASIERIARTEAERAALVAEGRARGLTDGDAELRAIEELERLGYYPRPPQLVAQPLSRADVASRRHGGTLAPLFRISPMEFRVGLFADIEEALAAPGTEVRYRGPYLRHSDYSTSQAINAFLASGGTEFFIETDRGVAAFRLLPAREATR